MKFIKGKYKLKPSLLIGWLLIIILLVATFLVKQSKSKLHIPKEVQVISAPLDNKISWKKFTSKDLFEIQYPSNWSIKLEDQTLQQGDIFNVTHKIQSGCAPGDECYNGASLIIREIKTEKNAKDYLAGIINYPGVEKEDPKGLLKKSVYLVDIGPHRYLRYEGCHIFCYKHFLLEHNSKLYDVTVTNQAYYYEEYDNILKQILTSLVFY